MIAVPENARQTPVLRKLDRWSLIVASNNDRTLRNNLLASPVIGDQCQVIAKHGFASAGKAYNAGISEAAHELLVFAHQDVILPPGWTSDLDRALAALAETDPDWGVLGVAGVESTPRWEFRGYCYSTGLRTILGQPFSKPVDVISLDEIVLVLRRSSGLKFDEQLPGFHLYGTDICLEAKRRGMRSYAASAFCIHNTNGIQFFPQDFWRGYFYLRDKWSSELPVRTCCTTITKWCGPAMDRIARDTAHRLFWSRKVGKRWEDVGALRAAVQQERETLESAQEPSLAAAARNAYGHHSRQANV